MKTLLSKRVPIAWLLVSLILSAATLIVGIAFLNAPPANSVIIDSPSATPNSASPASPAATSEPPSAAKGPAQGTPTGVGTLAPTQPASVDITQAKPKRTSSTSTPPASSPTAMSQALEAESTLPTPPVLSSLGSSTTPAPTDIPQVIAVYVSGAVQKPGVYTLTLGSRVADAIAAAGGPAGSADLEQINLAARVADEEHLAVPAKGDNPVVSATTPPRSLSQGTTPSPTRGSASAQRQPRSSPAKPTPSGKIDINSATAKELEALPGIGPVLAQRIVTYRQQNGPFASLEDLKLVPGIKDAIFARVRDHIVVNGP